MLLEGYPIVCIAVNRLKGRSHFTFDRFVTMCVKNFMNHDRIVIESNDKTLNLAMQISYMFQEAFCMEEQRTIERKVKDGREFNVHVFILEKVPAIQKG